jgi:hypothetical protein
MTDTPLGKFKTQIHATLEAQKFATLLLADDCGSSNFCWVSAEWEKYQTIANIASPESSWAVDTFVIVVLDEQRNLGSTLLIQTESYWTALLENLGSMIHQMHEKDYRKAYKYAMRISFCIDGIMGRSVSMELTRARV